MSNDPTNKPRKTKRIKRICPVCDKEVTIGKGVSCHFSAEDKHWYHTKCYYK